MDILRRALFCLPQVWNEVHFFLTCGYLIVLVPVCGKNLSFLSFLHCIAFVLKISLFKYCILTYTWENGTDEPIRRAGIETQM